MSVFSFQRWASYLAISTLLTVAPRTSAMENMQPNPQRALQPIEQPISRKVIVTLGGLGLIGAELWWFLRKPHQVQQATQIDNRDTNPNNHRGWRLPARSDRGASWAACKTKFPTAGCEQLS